MFLGTGAPRSKTSRTHYHGKPKAGLAVKKVPKSALTMKDKRDLLKRMKQFSERNRLSLYTSNPETPAPNSYQLENETEVALDTPNVVTARPFENAIAFSDAYRRGEQLTSTILAGEEMLAVEDFGRRVGLSRAAVNLRRQKRELLALEGAKRGFKYPDWQISSEGKPFSALPALFSLFNDNSWLVYRFLVQPRPEFNGQTAAAMLSKNEELVVLDVAEAVLQGEFS